MYTSSVATLASRTDGSASDETAPLDERAAIGAYKRSKVAAERIVETMVARDGLPAVIVNPSDADRAARHQAHAHRPHHRRGGARAHAGVRRHRDSISCTSTTSRAGHVAALERGRIGERYILGGENVPLASMLADIASLAGRRAAALEAAARAALSARRRG